jgi:nitrate reductase gamma subunit
MTIVTFAFHICLLITPIFLLAHIILIEEAWNLSWWSLPDGLADAMTLIVIAGCIFFLVRRLTSPEVQYVTSASDFVLLAIIAAPFVTGFWPITSGLGINFSSSFISWPEKSCW